MFDVAVCYWSLTTLEAQVLLATSLVGEANPELVLEALLSQNEGRLRV